MQTTVSAQPAGTSRHAATRTDAGAFTSLPRAGAVTAVAAALADLLVYGIAAALWAVPGPFSVLNPVTIVVTAVGGVVLATIGLLLLARLTRHAVAIFTVAVIAVTLLSLLGPVQAMAGLMPGLPPATTATGLTMIALHLLTGAFIAVVLPAQARR